MYLRLLSGARRDECLHKFGRVADLYFTVSHWQPTLIAIAKQPNDDVMHLDRSGKIYRLAGETLNPGSQRHMFARTLILDSRVLRDQ